MLEESYSSSLYNYLKITFPQSKISLDKRSWLKFHDTGSTIYVNGSKKHDGNAGWYDLDESIYDTLMSTQKYQAIVLGDPSTSFVMSKKVIQDIFNRERKIQSEGNRNRWMFSINENNSKYFLILGANSKHDITEYLNNWNIIPELSNSNNSLGFAKLQRFLLNEIQMEANYQPIMIKTNLKTSTSQFSCCCNIRRYVNIS